MLSGKRILLVIGGGVAAFKALELIRLFRAQGAAVTPVLTSAAKEFVTPLSASALAAEKVYTDLFDLTDEAEMGHIELSRSANLIVVAPATADLMAKMANGLANDLASTILMATDTRVLIAPAMNVRMWDHPATQRNIATPSRRGCCFPGHDFLQQLFPPLQIPTVLSFDLAVRICCHQMSISGFDRPVGLCGAYHRPPGQSCYHPRVSMDQPRIARI